MDQRLVRQSPSVRRPVGRVHGYRSRGLTAALAVLVVLTASARTANALTIVPTFTGFSAGETMAMQAALTTWDEIIADPLTLTLDINRIPLASYTLARSSGFVSGADGRPAAARIDMNADVDWFIDQTPLLNEEFTPTADPSRFEAGPDGPAADRFDLFTIFVHEVTHALGFSTAYRPFAEHVGVGPDGRKIYDGEVSALLAPTGGTHTAEDVYPGDLMNAFLLPSERRLPSYIDVRVLADAFGYDVDLPDPPPPVETVPEPSVLLLAAAGVAAATRRAVRLRRRRIS